MLREISPPVISIIIPLLKVYDKSLATKSILKVACNAVVSDTPVNAYSLEIWLRFKLSLELKYLKVSAVCDV